MGKLLNGFNGPFSGKMGTGVGVMWRGLPVIRSRPRRRTSGFSPRELEQQAKFALMSKFLRSLIPLLNQSFRPEAAHLTGYNKAFSYNVKNAIAGVYPALALDYPVVLLGRGDLPNVLSPSAASPVTGRLDFSWTDNSGKGRALATDQAFAAAYNEELKKWEYNLNLAPRSAGSCTMDISEI
ncbi:MAG: DUF6266 family protein, partial [Bacteroidota bacterium]|nr:DUF6266 family protein [Bacteroidota bacterium]